MISSEQNDEEMPGSATPESRQPSPSPSAAALVDLRAARCPPADAKIRYLVNVIRSSPGSERVIPQVVLGHDGAMRTAGFAHIVRHCAGLRRHVVALSVVTLLGLERVDSDASWDRAVGRVHGEMLFDGEVRVLVCVD